MKHFLKEWWKTILLILCIIGLFAWASTCDCSRRYRQYLKWEYFSNEPVLVLYR